jgi:hypothetical protein
VLLLPVTVQSAKSSKQTTPISDISKQTPPILDISKQSPPTSDISKKTTSTLEAPSPCIEENKRSNMERCKVLLEKRPSLTEKVEFFFHLLKGQYNEMVFGPFVRRYNS